VGGTKQLVWSVRISSFFVVLVAWFLSHLLRILTAPAPQQRSQVKGIELKCTLLAYVARHCSSCPPPPLPSSLLLVTLFLIPGWLAATSLMAAHWGPPHPLCVSLAWRTSSPAQVLPQPHSCHPPPPHSMQFTTQMSSRMSDLLLSWAIAMLNPNFLPGPMQLAPRLSSWILPVQFAIQWSFCYVKPYYVAWTNANLRLDWAAAYCMFGWVLAMLNSNFLPGPVQLAHWMSSWTLPVQFATQWSFCYVRP
jgi:hypothetical protein